MWAVANALDESSGNAPMPWTWELCLHCMDIKTGAFLHWPLMGAWADNAELLRLMRSTWRAWEHLQRINRPNYEMTVDDLKYHNWLMEGRPRAAVESDFERWKREQAINE